MNLEGVNGNIMLLAYSYNVVHCLTFYIYFYKDYTNDTTLYYLLSLINFYFSSSHDNNLIRTASLNNFRIFIFLAKPYMKSASCYRSSKSNMYDSAPTM